MTEQAKNGTATRIHGHACANPACSHHQQLIVGLVGFCIYCGHPLKPASVSAGPLRWADDEAAAA